MDTARKAALGVALAVAAVVGYGAMSQQPDAPAPPKKSPPKVQPPPKAPPKVDPDCPDGKCPRRPRRPWGEGECAPVGASRTWRQWPGSREYALLEGDRQVGSYVADLGVFRELRADGSWGPKSWLPAGIPHPEGLVRGGPTGPDGTEVQCEVPVQFRTRNIGSRVDGAGMCVTTATSVAARWSGLDPWVGVRDWAAQFPGGSMPDKHLSQLAQYGRAKGLGDAPWAQYVGRDAGPFLDAVLSSGRVACVSWMRGGHWLNLVHLDEKNACIMDNNGDPQNLQWMTRESALGQINTPYAWVGCWLPPGPPTPPKNVALLAGSGPTALPAYTQCLTQGVYLPELVGADELTIRGKSGTLDELKTALGPAGAPRLTVIGTPQQSAPVLAAHGSGLVAASYPPDAWQVSGMGFAPGSPAIYLQSADGGVIHRQDAYDPDALSEAIRKADPNYRPDADPSPSTPPPPGDAPDPVPLIALVGAAGGAAWLARRVKS